MASLFQKLHFNDSKSAVIAEFIGTFLYTLTVALATISNQEIAPIAYGFLMMALVFAFGYLSGAHFNPAVSFAIWLAGAKEGFGLKKVILYTIFQTGGATAAALYCVMIHGANFPTPNTPILPLSILQVCFSEAIFTFVLASIQLHVGCSHLKGNNFYGFAIGMAYLSGGLVMGGITGGVFNPAVATGLIVMRCVTTYCLPLLSVWIFWLGELVGAGAAAFLFRIVTEALATAHPVATS